MHNLPRPDDLALASRISRMLADDLGQLNNCEAVADILDEETDGRLTYMQGVRIVAGAAVQHAWNVAEDGTIVDATADQFGDEQVLVVPLWDARQQSYRHAGRFVAGLGPVDVAANSFFAPARLAAWDDENDPVYELLWRP